MLFRASWGTGFRAPTLSDLFQPAIVGRSGSVDPAFPHLPGPIRCLFETNVNHGDVETSGIDIHLRWRPATTAIDKFALSLTGTYVIDYKRTALDNRLFPSGAGARPAFFFNGALVRWRHFATLDWSYGPWAATLAQNYQDGYTEPCVTDLNGVSLDASGCTKRRVGSYSVFDLQGRYTGFRNVTLTLGVRNLFDTAPPLSN